MSYEPDFIKHREEYEKEKKRIKTLDDWIRFSKKWFSDRSEWPEKKPKQLREESLRKNGPVKIQEREWVYTNYLYDISPEARYEMFAALHEIGDPIRFPDFFQTERTVENGWRQECPFCEIQTDEIGDEICPLCGRKLIYTWVSD